MAGLVRYLRKHSKGGIPMKTVFRIAAFFVCLLVLANVAFAECNCADKLRSDNYWVRAPYRLLHGIGNALLGWTKLFTEPWNSTRSEGQDIVDGIFDGLGMTVYYTALGAWDIATFWFPGEGGKEIANTDCVFNMKS